MRPVRLLGLLSCTTLLMLILTGCLETLAPVRSLAGVSPNSTRYVAMAIESNGTKHYIWSDCVSGACKLIYYRTKVGEEALRLEFIPPANESYRFPDIAVLDSGVAYVVWRSGLKTGDTTLYSDYYTEIPLEPAGTPVRSPLAPGVTWNITDSRPQVAARGSNAYAAFEIPEANGSSLRYRQLAGGSSEGYVVQNDTEGNENYPPSLEIDLDGYLHVAWYQLRRATSQNYIWWGTNREGANMAALIMSPVALKYNLLSQPDTAIAANGELYIAYGYHNTTTESYVNYAIQSPPYGTDTYTWHSLTMDSADSWDVEGRVRVTDRQFGDPVQYSPAITFAAKNSSTSNLEIFYATEATAPTRLTNNTVDDDSPTIASVDGTLGRYPIVVWRNQTGIGTGCYDDTFLYYNGGTRQIAEGTGGCSNAGGDTAGAGIWGGTIWRDSAPGETRLVPWIDFNARIIHTPLIMR